MTDPHEPRPKGATAGRPQAAARLDTLPADSTGCWVVRTVHTAHLFDLGDAVYARVPGPGRNEMPHDRVWLRLLRFGVPPRVGGSFLIFVDDPDPAVSAFFELWRVSSIVVSIEAAPRERLDHLRTSPDGGES